MDRRDFAKTAALGALGATAIGCSDDASTSPDAPAVQTQPQVRWRLASSFTESLGILYGAAEVLAERVSALTGGRFQIRPYAAGELVPAFEVLGAVQNGIVQMGHSASYYFVGKNPALAFDATVPFGLTARQYNAWWYHGGGKDLMRALFSDFNIYNLPGGNTGMQMGGWFKQPITSMDDMQGLRMRIPGLGGKVMNRLGVNVQQIAGGEVYPALERGTVDAVEWVGPYDDKQLGFHEIASYYHYPGWWEPGPALTFYVNRSDWDALPTAYQEALTAAADVANVQMLARYDQANPKALEDLVQLGVTLQRFPNAVMRAAEDATAAILEEQAAQSPQYRTIYDSYTQFRSDVYRWFEMSELAYGSFAFPQPGADASA